MCLVAKVAVASRAMSDDDNWGPRRPPRKLTQAYINREGAKIKARSERKKAEETRAAEKAAIKAAKEAEQKEADAAQVTLFEL